MYCIYDRNYGSVCIFNENFLPKSLNPLQGTCHVLAPRSSTVFFHCSPYQRALVVYINVNCVYNHRLKHTMPMNKYIL